ncbi:MAG: flavodoxin domain-containing protein [Methanocella sp.]
MAIKLKMILLIAVAIVIIVVLGAFACMAAIIFDVNSNLAGGSETLSPAGNVTGHALVVYNSGILGGAKNVASTIADDLKAQGYSVVLAGVKSPAAADVSGYDIIVVGGPIYMGNASGSVKAYLADLHPPADATVGAFGFGSSEIDNADQAAVLEDVASLPAGSTLKIKAAVKLTEQDDLDKGCADFVAMLLK